MKITFFLWNGFPLEFYNNIHIHMRMYICLGLRTIGHWIMYLYLGIFFIFEMLSFLFKESQFNFFVTLKHDS